MLEMIRLEADSIADPERTLQLLVEAGEIYQDKVGDVPRAVEAFAQVLARQPRHAKAFHRLESIYSRGLAVASTVRPGKRTWTFEAALTYYDPRAGRFWPGHTPLGHGIARDLVVAPDGALWVTLPWAGELVRLELP
jgi:sugar lactone lactonase YvrE